MRRFITATGLALVLGAGLARAETDATTYPIQLTRSIAPGSMFSYRAEGMVDQTVNGVVMGSRAPTNTTRIIVRLDSTMTVDASDEHGRPTKTTHAVRSCSVTQGGEVIYEIEEGSTLTATANGRMTDLDIDGHPAPNHLLDALRFVSSLDGDGATEDMLYGSAQPRTVGESWPANSAALLDYFQAQTSVPMNEEQISGTSTLDSAFEYQGRPCIKVVTELATDGVVPGITDLPPDATLEKASMQTSFESLYPEGVEGAWLARSAKMDMHITMDSPGMGRLDSKTTVIVNLAMTPTTGEAVANVDE